MKTFKHLRNLAFWMFIAGFAMFVTSAGTRDLISMVGGVGIMISAAFIEILRVSEKENN